jgi:glutaredoxin-related protein
VKEALSQHGIQFTYVNITESMANLKAFLKYRDHHPAFAEVRQAGRVGLPCTVVDEGKRIFFGQPDLNELV